MNEYEKARRESSVVISGWQHNQAWPSSVCLKDGMMLSIVPQVNTGPVIGLIARPELARPRMLP